MKRETKINQIVILVTSLAFFLWTFKAVNFQWACVVFALNTVLWEIALILHNMDIAFNMKGKNNWGSKLVVLFLVIGLAVMGNGLQMTDPVKNEVENEVVSVLKGAPSDNVSVEQQIRDIANEHNFQWPDYLVRLSFCESRHNPYATNGNGGHSIDRGLFQWNDKYHPEISDECAFDIRCSTIETMNAINSGNQSWWVCDSKI